MAGKRGALANTSSLICRSRIVFLARVTHCTEVRYVLSKRIIPVRLSVYASQLDHISDALVSLHRLRSPKRVMFKVAVLMFKAIHGSAPTYLSRLVRVADLPGRCSLHSARSNHLLVPCIRLSTVGGRAFPVAGVSIWNNLPDIVTSAPTLSTLCQRLKTYLFFLSFPDIIGPTGPIDLPYRQLFLE